MTTSEFIVLILLSFVSYGLGLLIISIGILIALHPLPQVAAVGSFQLRGPSVLARRAGIVYLANMCANWCSDLSSLVTALLLSQ
jgi:hypothetical protein